MHKVQLNRAAVGCASHSPKLVLQKALVELDLFNQAQIWDSLLKHPDTAHGNIRANNIATRFKESQHNA
jgi:hypothetical protein